MPRAGSLTPADLIGKLDVLRVHCPKCGRDGRYRVAKLADTIGMDGKLTDCSTASASTHAAPELTGS